MSCSDNDGCEVERDLRARLAAAGANYTASMAGMERAMERAYARAEAAEARLAEVEAERNTVQVEKNRAEFLVRRETARAVKAEARLAEVEAELASEAEAHRRSAAGRAAAEARLAEVERALDDELANLATDGARLSHSVVRRIEAIVRAAAAGDRAEAEPVYPFGTPCRFAGTGCGEEYCTCAETVGHFCPIECVTCGAAGDDR